MIIRGLIVEDADGVISVKGRDGETITQRELFMQYGLVSRCTAGAEIIVIREGNCYFGIATEDRRYRLALEPGEVAIYDDLGQSVHLQRDRVSITSPTKIVLDAPLVEIPNGSLRASGEISDDLTGTKTLATLRTTYNQHRHGYKDYISANTEVDRAATAMNTPTAQE